MHANGFANVAFTHITFNRNYATALPSPLARTDTPDTSNSLVCSTVACAAANRCHLLQMQEANMVLAKPSM